MIVLDPLAECRLAPMFRIFCSEAPIDSLFVAWKNEFVVRHDESWFVEYVIVKTLFYGERKQIDAQLLFEGLSHFFRDIQCILENPYWKSVSYRVLNDTALTMTYYIRWGVFPSREDIVFTLCRIERILTLLRYKKREFATWFIFQNESMQHLHKDDFFCMWSLN